MLPTDPTRDQFGLYHLNLNRQFLIAAHCLAPSSPLVRLKRHIENLSIRVWDLVDRLVRLFRVRLWLTSLRWAECRLQTVTLDLRLRGIEHNDAFILACREGVKRNRLNT
jgi:hypothetical protein